MTKLGNYVLSGQEINSNVVKSIDEVGSEGGGGSSDFSTAEVTFTAENVDARLQIPYISGDYIQFGNIPSDEGEILLPVYKQGVVGILVVNSEFDEIVTTGDIQYVQIPDTTNYSIIVTGNGTIHLSKSLQ